MSGPFGKIHNKKCCCGTGCPCCPNWPQNSSGSITWTAVALPSDCSGGSAANAPEEFGCTGTSPSGTGTLILQDSTDLYVRVWCDYDTLEWHVQYRSGATGAAGVCESPAAADWVEVAYDFSCPDCNAAVDGIATGTIDFIAVMCCEISGPSVVYYDVAVHADIELPC